MEDVNGYNEASQTSTTRPNSPVMPLVPAPPLVARLVSTRRSEINRVNTSAEVPQSS